MVEKSSIIAKYTQPSSLETSLFIAYCFLLCLGPSSLAYFLIMSPMPMLVALVLSVPLIFISAAGFHLLAWAAHDGMHANLHSNRVVSFIIGIFVSAPIVVFSSVGFSLYHWAHHAATNQEGDPDRVVLSKYKTFWSRVVMGRLFLNRQHTKEALILLITGRSPNPELAKFIPLDIKTMRYLTALNFFMCLVWGVVHVKFALYDFTMYLVVILIPYTIFIVLSGVRPYLEHVGTGSGAGKNARSRTSIFWTFLEAGANYHNEHHSYPSVPQWRLPRLSRELQAAGYQTQHAYNGFLSCFKFATRRFQYP